VFPAYVFQHTVETELLKGKSACKRIVNIGLVFGSTPAVLS